MTYIKNNPDWLVFDVGANIGKKKFLHKHLVINIHQFVIF